MISDDQDASEWVDDGAPVAIPIDGILDLHAFAPKEVKSLVAEYIDACLEKGIYELRFIHGKGTGVLGTMVRSVLSKHPMVEAFRLGGHGEGGWGATLVNLKRSNDTR